MTAMHLSCMHVDLFITLNNAILLVALITRKYGIYCLKHKQYPPPTKSEHFSSISVKCFTVLILHCTLAGHTHVCYYALRHSHSVKIQPFEYYLKQWLFYIRIYTLDSI